MSIPRSSVFVDAEHAVDVGAEMRVRVEDVRAVGQFLAQLVVPLSHQLLRTLQRVVHVTESMQRPVAFADKAGPAMAKGLSLGPGRYGRDASGPVTCLAPDRAEAPAR